MVGVGVQVPLEAVRACPVWAVPVIEGSGEIVKVDGGGGDAVSVCTTAVWADVAYVDPFLLVATTTTRIVAPASPDATVYVAALAPSGAQAPPEASQRCHENESVDGGPAQAPASAESWEPTTADPEIDGGVVFFGADFPGPAAEEAATGSPARPRQSSAVRCGDWRRRWWSLRLKRRVFDIPPAIGGSPPPVFPISGG